VGSENPRFTRGKRGFAHVARVVAEKQHRNPFRVLWARMLFLFGIVGIVGNSAHLHTRSRFGIER